ncbi:MAG: sulfite exporter TauE/SafE family protein [Nitrospirota bacterium]|nr:sulfite exporter TauE/SafE family protein [Nitrospirota bacterium]
MSSAKKTYSVPMALTALSFALLCTGIAFAHPLTIEGHKAIADIPEALLLIIIGSGVGILGTLIGVGGGFIVVPILLIFYGFTPQHAIGTSMVVVFLNALSGTFSYMVQKRIDYEIGIKFSVAAVPGVLIGAEVSQAFNLATFSTLFAALLSLIAYRLFSGKEVVLMRINGRFLPQERRFQDCLGQTHAYAPDFPIGLSVSFFVGVISGLFGIGGGIIHVPLLYSTLGVPVHIATATSHFILAITSFFGVIMFLGLQSIDIDYAVLLGIGSVMGAYIGARLSLHAHPNLIKKVISFCLLLFAIKLGMTAI